MKCPTFNNIASGVVTLTSDGVRSWVTFTCATGYHLDGTKMAVCEAVGKDSAVYNATQPSCSK